MTNCSEKEIEIITVEASMNEMRESRKLFFEWAINNFWNLWNESEVNNNDTKRETT